MKKHKIILAFLIPLICLILINNRAFSQESKLGHKNINNIYGELGFGGFWDVQLFWFSYSIYYETELGNQLGNKNVSSLVRFGLGQIGTDNGKTYNYSKIQYELLFGKRSHHLELIGGLNYYFGLNKGNKKKLNLSTSIGWRYQKPDNKFIFRVGVGYPDVIHLGFGWSL